MDKSDAKAYVKKSVKPMALLLVLCFALYAIPYLFSTKITVTDELGLHYFSSLLAEQGTLKYMPEGDRIFGFTGFIPGQTVYGASGEALPRQPPGFILLAAAVKAVTPGQLFFLLNPILGVLCIVLLYAIARHFLTDDRNALYAALLLASTPVFVHWNQMFFVDIANLSAFLIAIWCLLKSLDTQRTIHLAGFGLSLGAMVWIRQSSVILLLPVAVYLFLNRHQITIKWCRLPAVCFGLSIALLMIYNKQIYGSPFQTGYTLGRMPRAEGTIGSDLTMIIELFTNSTDLYWLRIKWFIPAFSLAFPPLLLALIGVISGIGTPTRRSFTLLIVLSLVVVFAFFGGRDTYGFAKFDLTLQSSFLRYMLPFIALLPIPTIWTLEKLKIAKLRWISLIILLNLGIAAFAHFGVIHTILNRLYMEDVTQFIIRNTGEKTVVISPYWDHIIFPDRLVHSRAIDSPDYLMSVTQSVLQTGYDVALIYHESDSAMLDTLDKTIILDSVTGPDKLNVLLEWLPVPIPSHVYPVKLMRISPDTQTVAD